MLLLASGQAGPVPTEALEAAVAAACADLASQMAGDAEGATKVVRFKVVGAHTDDEALIGARAVARSQLVKCSWYGQDPYWGRIASDLGSCGILFDPELFCLSYGDVVVCRGAVTVPTTRPRWPPTWPAATSRSSPTSASARDGRQILTNDLTHAYIDENMGTS